jgi:hypothetical protein
MRITDDRYSRDRRRYDLAVRFIHFQARTQTIRAWTGLTEDRIRKLYRTYIDTAEIDSARHRGKSPNQSSFFTRSYQRRHETSVLGGVLCIFGAVPPNASLDLERTLPCISRGELLCEAFEMYQSVQPASSITFEHAAYLVLALARGDELRYGFCCDCGSLVVVDRLSLRNPRCHPCRVQALSHW